MSRTAAPHVAGETPLNQPTLSHEGDPQCCPQIHTYTHLGTLAHVGHAGDKRRGGKGELTLLKP
jgi:hypothetical protein